MLGFETTPPGRRQTIYPHDHDCFANNPSLKKVDAMALHLSLSSAVIFTFSYVFSPVLSITSFIHVNLGLPIFFTNTHNNKSHIFNLYHLHDRSNTQDKNMSKLSKVAQIYFNLQQFIPKTGPTTRLLHSQQSCLHTSPCHAITQSSIHTV